MHDKKLRPPKQDDCTKISKAVSILYEAMDFNKNIEETLWISAFYYVLLKGYQQSGFSYEELRNETAQVFDHYKFLFDTDVHDKKS